ncbi:hypothetical protein B9Y60_10635 [Stenotrophomonas maltophilia]|uniref:helicase HerA-like domain-containing protein n=1 Tax=Stenotrophomonas maltophilia TaxID=40324 RepID=UPI000C25DDB5|nr:helicase HerA-like domain-containing protein [Stenotrophomonas maltophilia]PJL52211.1 hypothetical protein B9Y73_10635 [Stenotrophomonas maltophilia]PJL55132.1 hypothetical protein B9Y60_10635 [Stenotrophomonas maltophilia]
MAKKIYDAIFTVPANIAHSMPVRYWGDASIVGVITPCITYPAILAALWAIPGQGLIPYARTVKETMKGFFYLISAGSSFAETVKPFIEDFQLGNTWGMGLRIGVAVLATGFLTFKVTAAALKPRSNVTHVSGNRLVEGEEALQEAKHRGLSRKDAKKDPYALYLHPALLLPKKFWSRHMLIYGSVGSGKSVILKFILKQFMEKDAKCFIYDVKGDFTSIFRKPIIVSPFDKRSYVWDVACDVRTLAQANEFALSMIPEPTDKGTPYWTNAPREILVGCLIELQLTKPRKWSWNDLSQMLLRNANEFKESLEKYYPQAVAYVDGGPDNQTVGSVISSLMSDTKLIHDLARAWPQRKEKRRFSITEWVKDDYTGRKQVIVQGGPMLKLTKAYISALINVAIPEIISPALPDNEEGRMLGFVIDEMSSINIQFAPLVDKGRSKGVVCIFAVQDLVNQLAPIYGKEATAALGSMVGSHLICQTQMGSTRNELAQMIGKNKVSWFSHGTKESASHEEGKSIISPGQLTDELGFRKGKKFGPLRWGIRAMFQNEGNVLMLDWPGENHAKVRNGQEQAGWVTKDTTADLIQHRAKATVNPNDLLSSDEMTMPIADEEEALWVKKQLEQQFPEVLASTPTGAFLKARDELLNAVPELTEEQQANLELKQRLQQGIDERTKNIEKHLKGKIEIDPDNDPFGLLDSESFTVEPEEEEEDDEGVEGVQANAMTPKISISDLDELMNQAKLKR